MYKDPLLKSKKKDAPEIDITDFNEASRRKIKRINEENLDMNLYGGKVPPFEIPEEEIPPLEIPEGEYDGTLRVLVSIEDSKTRYFEADPAAYMLGARPAGRPFSLRGRWVGNNGAITHGYITKPIMWITQDAIYTDVFTNNPGYLRVIRHDGERRKCILYTAKQNFIAHYFDEGEGGGLG